MVNVPRQTLTFALAAAIVLAVSVRIDLRRSAVETVGELPRFSGSAVVADLPSLLPPARLSSGLRVAIVRDEAAVSFYDAPATFDSIVQAWRSELSAIGADARVLSSNALSGERSADVLVVPASPCLTLETRAALENAGTRGQGVILSGPVGTYDAGCRWIGYGTIVGLTNAARVEVLEPRGMVYVVLPAGSPLSADIPPGARIELNPAGQVALRHPHREGYYSDYALQPEPAGGKPLLDGALVRATVGNARIVYFGFEPRNIVQRPWNQSVARLLLRNSVAWAARQPFGWVEPWPRGRRTAAVFAQDVEDQFRNARHALDSLRAVGVPGTYYLTSKLAAQHRRLTRDMAAAGEVGTHSENHQRLGGAPGSIQNERLRITQRELKRLLGSPVAGLRPPEEQFDTLTMAAWLAAGGSYLFGVNDARAAAPELLRVGHDTLVLVGRIAADDFAMAARAPGAPRDARSMETRSLNELAQARALGGLYLFSYHSQLLSRPELVPVLARVARRVASDSTIWPATAGQIAGWWRERADLRVETRTRNAHTLNVIVRNHGAHPVSGAVARTVLREPRRVLGATAPLLPAEAGVVRLALPTIAAGATTSFTIRLDPGRSQPSAAPSHPAPVRYRPAPRKPRWWEFWKRL